MFKTQTAYIIGTGAIIMLTALAGVLLAATLYVGPAADATPAVNDTETTETAVTPTETHSPTESIPTETPDVTTDTATESEQARTTCDVLGAEGCRDDYITPTEWADDNTTHIPDGDRDG